MKNYFTDYNNYCFTSIVGLHESPTILTNGGRYDVNVAKRSRTPVYWKEEPLSVMRCSWFYKREKDGRYIPYDEDFSQRLEVCFLTDNFVQL